MIMYTRLTSVHIIIVLNRCGKCVPNFTPLRLLSRTRAHGNLLTYLHIPIIRYNIILYIPIGCLVITTSTAAVAAAVGEWPQMTKRRTRINLFFNFFRRPSYKGKLVAAELVLRARAPNIAVVCIIFAVGPDRDPLAGRKLHPPW